MSPTVHELRNEIRQAVGRFERQTSTGFTKEDIAAMCEAFGHDVGEGRLPPKSEMRAAILRESGIDDDADPDDHENAFRKAELEAIAAALDER
jgi:DNA-directed RNA polymerase specialized sigma subunit